MPVNQRTITRRYTDKAIEFVTANKDKPFFLYLPHSMPYITLVVPQDVHDSDPKNAYQCVIEHIDAEVGRLAQTVRDLGLAQNTYIIFTTDNGPWIRFKHHGGSAHPLRDGKGTTFEGGQRVPYIMWGLSETTNLAAENPEKVEALRARMIELDHEITANARPVWRKSSTLN